MQEITSLIEALEQYNKSLAKEYKAKIKLKNDDLKLFKKELIHEIKKSRWIISNGKSVDEEFSNHFEKYFVDKEEI